MSPTKKPTVLVVDDDLSTARSLEAELGDRARIILTDPSDVEADDLAVADLILVDYTLDDWADRETFRGLADWPRQGLALAAVLRAHTDALAGDRPVAFALYSGRIASIAGTLPTEVRDHVLARLNNLEWVFEKGSTDLGIRIGDLADAVVRLGAGSASEAPAERLERFLALPDAAWADSGRRSVEACHPPLHELSEATHMLALLRWFAHRILPYPCFLWDRAHVAAALGITPTSLEQVLSTSNQLRDALDPVAYGGAMSQFLGGRWWRAGIENVVWDTVSDTADMETRRATLSALARTELEALPSRPVVPIDADYQPADAPVAVELAVRVQPDDWPPFADDAWTTLECAREDDHLRSLVVESDRPLLDAT
jgi:hypothetical protein